MSDALKTRRPTGKPPWPIVLIAGAEKTGKSYAAAVASASNSIGRTFWVSIGEDDPDEYGAIPGARFEIVEHDGSYRGILGAVDAACAQPSEAGRPNMVVIDSATRLWGLLIDDAQAVTNHRAAEKARKYGKPVSADDQQITMDLWNNAKKRWENIVLLLQSHNGPSIITSRFALVAVIENGKPTTAKEWKVKAEKSLPYDVGAVIEMPKRGEAYLTHVRSLKFTATPGERVPYNDFTIEKLWTDLGIIAPDATTPRIHAEVQVTNPNAEMLAEIGSLADQLGKPRAEVDAEWADLNDGQPIKQATDAKGLGLVRDDLAARLRVKAAS